jgi:2-amino-1-hydroxyethylphosphonate dioxygenase (glycine-forming)
MTPAQAEKVTDEIMELYNGYGGNEYAGEKVTQLEHMVQAAELAEEQGFDEEVVLAAFLHDIGHISEAAKDAANGASATAADTDAEADSRRMGAFGIKDHEELGAEFLREKGFSKKVCRLVESHVEAKRYLTARDPAYYAELSDASKKTLEYQGGPMTDEEADAFEQYPLFTLIIQMRKWDEQAKIEHKPLPDLQHYRRMMLRHLLNS